jgi:hypothetical protein
MGWLCQGGLTLPRWVGFAKMGWPGSIPSGLGITFWSCRGHFFKIFGMCWNVFGSTLGMFLDGFGRVWRKSVDFIEKSFFSKMSGSIFPASGCL